MAVKPTAFLLDTSAYSAFNRGDARVRTWFSADHTIQVPLIVIGELRAGFAAGSKPRKNEKLLDRFLSTSSVQILALSLKTTEVFASLFLQLRQAGKPTATNDLWIAALALEHNLPILTLDSDFQRIKGITVVKL